MEERGWLMMVDGGRVKWWEELDGCALRWIRGCGVL